MPQVTVYVRTDDLDKWKALSNKAEFLHNALHGTLAPSTIQLKPITNKPNPAPKNEGLVKSVKTPPTPTVIKNADQALAAIKTLPKQVETVYCKNGHIADYRGVCMWKGCKYA